MQLSTQSANTDSKPETACNVAFARLKPGMLQILEKGNYIMKYPNYYHGKETLVYYSIVLWPVSDHWGKSVKTVYKTAKGAERKARKEMESGLYKGATIREEKVFLRDENNEFSSSGVYADLTA